MTKILIRTILCGVVLYVSTFVAITRWSLHVERELQSPPMKNVYYYYAPPYNCVQIANSSRLESIHSFLWNVFVPLAFLDYHLTGCYSPSLPSIKLSAVPPEEMNE